MTIPRGTDKGGYGAAVQVECSGAAQLGSRLLDRIPAHEATHPRGRSV